ncbi:ImmA/IrrE family metallo-endopeptidase [Chloroflexota bacterium]
MSDEGTKVELKEIPKWESELWSHLSSGDGMHCPQYTHCWHRQNQYFCLDNLGETITHIIDSEQFNADDYSYLRVNKPGSIFQSVEMLAHNYLMKAGVYRPPVPAELFSLADPEHYTEIRYLSLNCLHGSIWNIQDKWVIQLRETDTQAKKRHTLFHEVFHILAHCNTRPVFSKRGKRQGYFNELLADYFASCVLQPREWIKEMWLETMKLDKMAEIFNVPMAVMWLKLKETGLL